MKRFKTYIITKESVSELDKKITELEVDPSIEIINVDMDLSGGLAKAYVFTTVNDIAADQYGRRGVAL